MNFTLVIFVLLSIIFGVVCKEAGASQISYVMELFFELGKMKATLGEQATKLNQQAVEIEKLQNDLHRITRPTPAFMTFMSTTNLQFSIDQNIVFPDVRLNVGNHYNPHTGVFQAPQSGTYHFALTLSNNNQRGTRFNAFIVAGNGNKVLGYVFDGDDWWESWQERTVSVLAHLEVGENVWIKCRTNCQIAQTIHSCFSGFLVDGR